MQAPLAERNAMGECMGLVLVQRVPAHMRNLQGGIDGPDAIHGAWQPAQPSGHTVFRALRRQQLHADADAQKRHSVAPHALLQRLHHAGRGCEVGHAIRIGPVTGQHDAVSRAHDLRVVCDGNIARHSGVGHGALQRLAGGMEIARAVIDQRNSHSGLTPVPVMPGRLRARQRTAA